MVKRLISLTVMITTYTTFLPNPVVAGSCTPVPLDTICSVQDSVKVTATVPDVTTSFTGFAAASSTVTLKDNGSAAGKTVTNASGQFNRSIISTPGTHDFALFLTDTAVRTTPETLFDDINLLSHGVPVITFLLIVIGAIQEKAKIILKELAGKVEEEFAKAEEKLK